jgi:hypothetical protein
MTMRRAFTLVAVAVLAGLALWNWVVVLLSAPWLAALVWVIARWGANAVVPDDEAFPSAAELARRRLAH